MANLPSQKDAKALFWGVTGILLIVGAGSWILNACFFPPDTTGWLRLQPDMTSPLGRALGIGVWAGAAALCVALLRLILNARDFLTALAAMWLPVALLCAAGYLLFFNDQGRELGHSLLGDDYRLPTVFLFAALFYWAANTWHTARLGINRSLKNGVLGVAPSLSAQLPPTSPNRRVLRGDERWLYWPPRLLGVCAHLLAALNLSLAAWSLPLAAPSILGFGAPQWAVSWLTRNLSFAVALSAPLAIVLATAFVWAQDVRRSSRMRRFTSDGKIAIAHWVSWASLVALLAVLAGLAAVALNSDRIPRGFLPGTISIVISAMAFLGLISWLKNLTPPLGAGASDQNRAEDDAWQHKEIRVFTIGLFAIAVLFTLLVWTFADQFGVFGSMVVAYFALGAILALANAIELAIEFSSGLPVTKRWLGDWATPRALGSSAVALAVVFGVVNAWLHPFHRVRLCDGRGCAPVMSPDQRPKVVDAAKAWYVQAKAAFDDAQGKGPVPMLIVATAGGGIRAAYWTATILEKLEGDFEAEGGSLRPYLFAISGVSGGSVGAMDFEAALARRDENHCAPDKPGDTASKPGDRTCPRATDFLKADFLAPALASLVFEDAPSSFLPDFGQGDRGAALEESFEHASKGMLARPFLSFFPYKEFNLLAHEGAATPNGGSAPPWRPILLLNATHEETGNRIITGHVLVERNVFVDSLDALNTLGTDVRASTAAHNSARFTYVSPAGYLGGDRGSVIDGGYFENFGALSALELAHAATKALNDDAPQPKVKLVILMISSDPDLASNHMLVRINESPTRHPGKCLVSVAERGRTSQAASGAGPTSERPPNYFSPDQGEVENAWINEFLAPFQGLEKVREAHGNWAAAELALEVCADFATAEAPKPDSAAAPGSPGEPPPTQVADVRDNSEDVIADETEAVDVTLKPDHPYFAHLAMCETPKGDEPAPIQPPLGWVLSKWTEDHFDDLLKTCGNEKQLPQLETALRGKPPQVGGQESQPVPLAGAESH
jgi:hypothetical protein